MDVRRSRTKDTDEWTNPTYQREYIAWNTSAKLPETKTKRLAETMAALSTHKKWAQRREAL